MNIEKNTQSAFSLVELSIVLVILGLLTGGILTGQSLVKAAELRTIVSEIEHYQAATNTFKQKYFALPGDMNNATQFWGKLNSACSGHSGIATINGVCNGNGNGNVFSWADTNGGPGSWDEGHMFWKQLARAGLINGTFTGISGSGTNEWHNIIDVNAPSSRAGRGTGYFAFTTGPTYNLNYSTNLAPWWFTIDMVNTIAYGNLDKWGINSGLTAEEIWNIDKKMDDGKPAKGKMICLEWEYTTTATSTNNLNADYDLSSNSESAIAFRELF